MRFGDCKVHALLRPYTVHPAKPGLRSAARQVAAAGPRQGALGDQLVHAPPDQPGVGDVNLHRPRWSTRQATTGMHAERPPRRDAVDRLPRTPTPALGTRAYYDDVLGSSVA